MELDDLIGDDYRKVKLKIPNWAIVVYILISIGLAPWTVYLGLHLPANHITQNWDMTWVGLDIALIISLLITGILAKFESIYLISSASVTGTLFLADAWFDILGYRMGTFGSTEAILMAVLGELPMAIMSFSLAIHGLTRLHAKKT